MPIEVVVCVLCTLVGAFYPTLLDWCCFVLSHERTISRTSGALLGKCALFRAAHGHGMFRGA
eukprot:642691-Amphidinium_carterae.1